MINLIEMLYLKRAVHYWMPANLDKLEQRLKEEWAKIQPQRSERHTESDYFKLLLLRVDL